MKGKPKLEVIFFRSSNGTEHVREWLKSLDNTAKKVIGEEIKTVQFGWPNNFNPPNLVKNIVGVKGLSEVRSSFRRGRQPVRILFTVEGSNMVLLHGFFRQRRQMSKEIELAQRRLTLWKSGAYKNE